MKKKIFSAFVCLLLLAMLFSCGGRDTAHLDMSNYGADFRQNNEVLFFNENCEHSLVCVSAAGISDTVDANVYHAVKCNRGNCGYEMRFEPHVLREAYLIPRDRPQYMENGYLYHRVPVSCQVCGVDMTLYVYCPRQDKSCGAAGKNECLTGCDWRELLCDTPYVISSD